MTIKAILFDADGVTINAEMFSKRYEERHGLPADQMLPFFKGPFQQCVIGQADLKEELKPYLKEWRWDKSIEEFLQFWFEAEHQLNTLLAKHIKILRSNGVKCYLATNQEQYRTNYLRENMGFQELFDFVFSSAEIGCKKPQKEYFEHILQALNVHPEEVLFFDDAQKNIDGAKACKIQAHLYSSLEEFEKIVKPFLEQPAKEV